MRAAYYESNGAAREVLRIAEVETPEPGPGEVRVRLRTTGPTAAIEVSDSGPGIREADAERIFERLYRSGSAVAQQVPGAGLGLTIALAIAEAHHGSLGLVRSGPAGTTFRMELPLVQ